MSFEKKLDLVGVALCQILPCNWLPVHDPLIEVKYNKIS